jgi:hypothetical protein
LKLIGTPGILLLAKKQNKDVQDFRTKKPLDSLSLGAFWARRIYLI